MNKRPHDIHVVDGIELEGNPEMNQVEKERKRNSNELAFIQVALGYKNIV